MSSIEQAAEHGKFQCPQLRKLANTKNTKFDNRNTLQFPNSIGIRYIRMDEASLKEPLVELEHSDDEECSHVIERTTTKTNMLEYINLVDESGSESDAIESIRMRGGLTLTVSCKLTNIGRFVVSFKLTLFMVGW